MIRKQSDLWLFTCRPIYTYIVLEVSNEGAWVMSISSFNYMYIFSLSRPQMTWEMRRNNWGNHYLLFSCRVGTPLSDLTFRDPLCLTCNASADCQYVDASFSGSGRHYVLGCLGPGIPSYRLRQTNGPFGNNLFIQTSACLIAVVTNYRILNLKLDGSFKSLEFLWNLQRFCYIWCKENK